MSEQEQLEKGVQESRINQQIGELSAYLDMLSSNIDKAIKRKKDSIIVYMVIWGSWVLTGFFAHGYYDLFELFFILGLIYDQWRWSQAQRAFGAFFSAIEVLRILGMIPPRPSNRDRKRESVWEKGVELVKSWTRQKQEAQEKVLSPA